MRRALIIPAAGRGSRLGTDIPKALVEVAGQSMLSWLADRYRPFVERIVVVASPSGEESIRTVLRGVGPLSEVCVQASPTGMLDAILIAVDALRAAAPETLWITWCDQIGITEATAATLASRDTEADLVFPTLQVSEPYIHFQRDASGKIVNVLQRREDDAMPAVGEADMGLFSLSSRAGFELLPEFARKLDDAGGRTGERNFLPFIPWLESRAATVVFSATVTFAGVDPIEPLGVNTPADLARMEAHLRG